VAFVHGLRAGNSPLRHRDTEKKQDLTTDDWITLISTDLGKIESVNHKGHRSKKPETERNTGFASRTSSGLLLNQVEEKWQIIFLEQETPHLDIQA
jgi:hypothetical protein